MKKIALSTIAVFAAWSVIDFIIHGMILSSSYAATASLWRPMAEMKMGVMYLAVFISAFAFVMIFSQFFFKKGMVVMDIVYDPLMTPLLVEAKKAGCEVITGDRMLLHQAEKQFEIWFGRRSAN